MNFVLAGVVSALILAAGALAGTAQAATDPASVPFVDRTVTVGGTDYAYQVFVPAHWSKNKKWPVILFLHGSGERGSDNRAQTRNGIRLLIAQDLDHFPAVVVCPQCREDTSWNAPEMQQMALQALDQTVHEMNGDTSRIYLTGLSMGGYGTWSLAQQYPEKWAAIVPCCGGIARPGQHGDESKAAGQKPDDPYYDAALKVKSLPA